MSVNYIPLPTPPRNVLFTSKQEALDTASSLVRDGVITTDVTVRVQTDAESGAPNPNPDGRLPHVIEWTEPVVVRDVTYPIKSSSNAGEIYQYIEHYPVSVPWRKILQGDASDPSTNPQFEVDKV